MFYFCANFNFSSSFHDSLQLSLKLWLAGKAEEIDNIQVLCTK